MTENEQHTVLVADDSSFARKVLTSYLLGTPFRIVATADTGKSAIEQFEALRPEIVLLDVIMPDLSGADVLKRIIQVDPAAKAVMVSSLGTENMVAECLSLGAKGFVQKPTNKETLLAAIRKAIG